ncbi:DNA polymerase II [archaeon]|jgi:DNA polymerase II|nr:DNA polymerase II [archaeon]MBT4397682.1 DNA polymerase II [archaeon]MBT4441622.1 DNA polymerase II [archaeon]
MIGFIVDATYRIMDGRAYVCLFGRLENGESFLTVNYIRPYFFILKKDLKKALKVENFEYEEVEFKTFDEQEVVKILLDIPKDVPELRKGFDEEGIKTFEADIRFVRRFLMDRDIQGYVDIDGDHDYSEGVDRFYREPELKKGKGKIDLKLFSMDIETNPKATKIYSVSIVCGDYKKVLVVSDKKLKNAINCRNEEELLEKFFTLLYDLDPDVITGWNLLDFDLKVIRDRCKKHEIAFAFGKDNSPSRLVIKKGFFESSTMKATGRQVIDAMDFLKRSFVKLSDYKLDTAAQHFLGEKKSVEFKDKGKEITDMYENDTQTFVDYNLKDSQLVVDILDKSGILSLTVKRSELTGLLMSEVSGSIASLDSVYLKRLRKKGYVVSSLVYVEKEERIKGGFVMDPKVGIYDNILVLDFKSLYPSLMRTFNIDPLAFGKKGIKAPNGATFSLERSIMPEIIEELLKVREEYRKKKDEIGRYAVKILMNSFFGVFASPNCRFFNLDMANAITSFAQFFIKKTADELKKRGYEVIYSDTDSCFVVSGEEKEEDAAKIGKKLEKEMNEFYDEFIKKEFKVDSYLELEYEKCYTKFLMPKLRGKEGGAKKRYAGLVDGKLEITGMEAVRGDWTPLAKRFQVELLNRVFKGENVKKFVTDFVAKLKKGKFDDQLVYSKSIRKPLEEYVKTTPPHIKAARKLDKFEGTRIKYVITSEGPEPVERVKGHLDYTHYLNKQVKPIAESILVFFELNFDELLTGQRDLFSY